MINDKLKPGDPDNCPGNGKADPRSCCCDECEHFLFCFPEWDEQGKEFQKLVGLIPTFGEK